jgi:predicted metalloprotease
VHKARQRVSEREANALSVRMELQADCLAGVWGKHTDTMKQVLEPGDLEAALTAASAIGDDRLQQQAQAASCRRALPTAPPNSACAGSAAASRPAT